MMALTITLLLTLLVGGFLFIRWCRAARLGAERPLTETDWQPATDELEERRRRHLGALRDEIQAGTLAIPPPPSSIWRPGVEEWSRRTNPHNTPGLALPNRHVLVDPPSSGGDTELATALLIASMPPRDLDGKPSAG